MNCPVCRKHHLKYPKRCIIKMVEYRLFGTPIHGEKEYARYWQERRDKDEARENGGGRGTG